MVLTSCAGGFLICLKGLANRDKFWSEGGVLRFFESFGKQARGKAREIETRGLLARVHVGGAG